MSHSGKKMACKFLNLSLWLKQFSTFNSVCMCVSSLLLPALLCWVPDWCLLMLQIVKEVMTLDRHDMFHWLEVLELSLLDWQSTWEHSYPCYLFIWNLYPLWHCLRPDQCLNCLVHLLPKRKNILTLWGIRSQMGDDSEIHLLHCVQTLRNGHTILTVKWWYDY